MKLLMTVVKEMVKGPFASFFIINLFFPSGANEADVYECSEFCELVMIAATGRQASCQMVH